MTPKICKAARALAGLSQRELAEAANLATQTVADFERGARQPHSNNLAAMRHVFTQSGILFIEDQGRTVGVRVSDDALDAEETR